MTVVGTLRKQFFGGVVWTLERDEGGPIQLEGDIPAHLEGRLVEVSGRPIEGAMGLAMAGEIWEVHRIRAR